MACVLGSLRLFHLLCHLMRFCLIISLINFIVKRRVYWLLREKMERSGGTLDFSQVNSGIYILRIQVSDTIFEVHRVVFK